MKTKIIKQQIYVADDGAEFMTENECRDYESVAKEIKYFRIDYSPDLCETGCYQKSIFVAVHSLWGIYGKEITFEWALRYFKKYLIGGVQGYGVTAAFEVCPINRKDFMESFENKDTEHLYLSNMDIPTFPKDYFNYYKEWGFK